MHQTPKSKLKILSQQSQPKIPQIFLSRQKHKPINRNILQSDSKQSYQAKEVIIDAKKYNNHSNLSRQRSKRSLRHSQGIRAEIDICLNAIQNVYEEERSKKNMINRRSNIQEQNGSVACNNSIHRVDSNIILEYIHTIEKDYGVPNYFQQNEEFILALQQKMQGFSLKNPQSRYNSDMKKRKGSPKTFLSLTLSQARAKRSNSTTKEKEISQKKQVNLTHYPSTGNFPTINHFDLKQHHSIRQKIDLNNKPEIKILDEYKYCINCQQKILIFNINFHEKNQCTNLQQLYKMDYKSLKEFVHNKIVKIKGFILISLTTFQRNAQIKQTIRQKELQFLDQMHLFLKSLENIQTNKLQYSQTKAHFNKLLNLPKNVSLNLLIQAQKLNWFVNIYCQICHHQNKQQSNISQIIKNETIKNGLHHKDKQYNSNITQLKSIQQFSQKQT